MSDAEETTMEEDVDRLEAVAEEAATEADVEKPKGLTMDDVKVGFISGLTNDDDFVFEIIGKDPTLIELMGLVNFAEKRVKRIFEEKQFSGDMLVNEVGKAVAVVKQQLDQVLAAVLPPKEPDNKL
ncbi:unnamed protein product [marine sediment metagenome]|uniref:Uncharacterized protein n=1 Tax=marine sediment metagenome TaxID=412755 RepID=X0UY44_9ZZZZ